MDCRRSKCKSILHLAIHIYFPNTLLFRARWKPPFKNPNANCPPTKFTSVEACIKQTLPQGLIIKNSALNNLYIQASGCCNYSKMFSIFLNCYFKGDNQNLGTFGGPLLNPKFPINQFGKQRNFHSKMCQLTKKQTVALTICYYNWPRRVRRLNSGKMNFLVMLNHSI
jgi:hypothetical protein